MTQSNVGIESDLLLGGHEIVVPGESIVIHAGHPDLQTVEIQAEGLVSIEVNHSGNKIEICRDENDLLAVVIFDADGQETVRYVMSHNGRG